MPHSQKSLGEIKPATPAASGTPKESRKKSIRDWLSGIWTALSPKQSAGKAGNSYDPRQKPCQYRQRKNYYFALAKY